MDALLCMLCGDRGCPECEIEPKKPLTDADLVYYSYKTFEHIVRIMSEVQEGEMKEQAIRGLVVYGLAQEALDKIEEAWVK